jgi:mannose-6-phosphate isomerase-like protein (cupin superfamily)
MRRVVTGHDEHGRSTVVDDAEVEGFPAGGENHAWVLWGRDDAARYPDRGEMPDAPALFPPVGGCRISMLRLAPGATEEFDKFVVGGLAGWADAEAPGMHRTASLDFDVVISGEVTLELETGPPVTLSAGDVVVQNGTKHRWRNDGTVDALMAAICIGAEHDLVDEPD